MFCFRWCGVYTGVSKSSEYLWKKNEVFYFRRHVPVDVQKHYERSSIVICLKTKSKPSALRASKSIASKLDDFWFKMRLADLDVPESHLLMKANWRKHLLRMPQIKWSFNEVLLFKGAGPCSTAYSKQESEMLIRWSIILEIAQLVPTAQLMLHHLGIG